MRGVNTCVICGNHYAGKKGLPCGACVKIVEDYHAALKNGAADNCIVELPDRWIHLGTGPSADAAEAALLTIFNAFPHRTYKAEGYTCVETKLPIPYGFWDGGRAWRAVPAPQAQAFADLLLILKATISEARSQGLAEGRNLLAQLNAGELTTEAFERRAGIRKE